MIFTTAKQNFHTKVLSDKAFTLTSSDYKDPPTLTRVHGGGENMDDVKMVVRRLTPLECERLQGFPDEWTNIGEYDPETQERYFIDENGKKRKVSDSARYKALGNSICTPFWQYLARRICAQYERTVTMGSLFSGIGGFEYVFQKCGAIPLWASEIESFPIAVTKEHFPEERDE